jgi:hypothetical protein
MRILMSIANSISSRTLFDKVLADSGFEPTEVVVQRLRTGEQTIVRWAIDNHWAVTINPKTIEEVCELVDAAIVIRRGRQANVGDAAVERLRSLGKQVYVHNMSDGKFKTEFGASTRAQ